MTSARRPTVRRRATRPPPTTSHTDAIPLVEGIHWVGAHDEAAGPPCNSYVLFDGEHGVLVDCGPTQAFPVMMRKVRDVMPLDRLRGIVLTQPTLDACGALPLVASVTSGVDITLLAHSDTLRSLRHMDVSVRTLAVDDGGWHWALPSGRILDFVAAPYLHSPGSIMSFDQRSHTLFSGALFGSEPDRAWSLRANDGFVERMRPWHELQMSSSSMLRRVLSKLDALVLHRILPQHGSVLEGAHVGQAVRALRKLPCGVDLLGELA